MTGLDRVNDKQLPTFPWVRSESWGGPQRDLSWGGGSDSELRELWPRPDGAWEVSAVITTPVITHLLAAKWIDETFADAEDHSVPVAVFSCRTAQTGVTQADELIKIEDYATKAKFVKEVELQDENTDTGMAAAENLYITDPDIKIYLTAHNGLALGINNYFTGLSSPVTDYSDMGIFCVNGNEETGKLIQASVEGETPFRGMVLTGGVQDTCNEIRDVVTGIYSGELPSGTVTNATTVFVNGETADEYLETGKTAITLEDFDVEEAA